MKTIVAGIMCMLMIVVFGCSKGPDVQIKKVAPCKVAFIAETGDYSKLGATIGELYGYLGSKSLKCTGMCFGIFYDNPDEVSAENLKWEVCVPIKEPVLDSTAKPAEDTLKQEPTRVNTKDLPEIEVACLIHKGPYGKASPCWKSLFGWVFKNGYIPAGPGREVWLNNPAEVPADSLLTEVQVPIKKK